MRKILLQNLLKPPLTEPAPGADDPELLALAGQLRGAEGGVRLSLLFERLADQVRAMLEESAKAGEGGSPELWFDAWDRLTQLPAEAEALNLDRQDVLYTAVAALREAARA